MLLPWRSRSSSKQNVPSATDGNTPSVKDTDSESHILSESLPAKSQLTPAFQNTLNGIATFETDLTDLLELLPINLLRTQ